MKQKVLYTVLDFRDLTWSRTHTHTNGFEQNTANVVAHCEFISQTNISHVRMGELQAGGVTKLDCLSLHGPGRDPKPADNAMQINAADNTVRSNPFLRLSQRAHMRAPANHV